MKIKRADSTAWESIRLAAPESTTGNRSQTGTALTLPLYSEIVDPTFRFMTVDWDGQIRMDPSSPYAMQRLIGLKDRFQIAFACDTDHDRHGIVTKSSGLDATQPLLDQLPIYYLFQHRPKWPKTSASRQNISHQLQ